MAAVGIIPARLTSARLPRKPLAHLFGKPLIQHTYEAARRASKLDHLVVATDDDEIRYTVENFGGKVIMTDSCCPTGTDRAVQALHNMGSKAAKFSIVVNIQGDEPLVSASHIDTIVDLLRKDCQAAMATLVAPIQSEDDAYDRNVVKCVVDNSGNALYFSRALIPHSKSGKMLKNVEYLRHIGLYGFKKEFFVQFPKLHGGELEQTEELEQLRVLQNGYRIKTAKVSQAYHGVDTQEQLDGIEKIMKAQAANRATH